MGAQHRTASIAPDHSGPRRVSTAYIAGLEQKILIGDAEFDAFQLRVPVVYGRVAIEVGHRRHEPDAMGRVIEEDNSGGAWQLRSKLRRRPKSGYLSRKPMPFLSAPPVLTQDPFRTDPGHRRNVWCQVEPYT